MKKIILMALLVSVYAVASAQFKQIAAGPEFDEPSSGFAKLLPMKNGSVMFFRIGLKDGIDVRVYDAAHKEIATTSFEPAYGKLKAGSLENTFEIGGDAVLLISEVDDKKPVLYRLIIDGKTGKLKTEEKIAELKKMSMGMGYAMAFGGVSAPDFYTSKDPGSENYAIALFNSFESDRSKRIEIILYGSDHKELSRAFYASPDEKYKYLEYQSMTVIGSDMVSVLVNGHNGGRDKDKEVILATLKKGASAVDFHELKFPTDINLVNALVRYNPSTKRLVVAAEMYEKNEKEARLYVAFVDPVAGKTEKVFESGITAEAAQRGIDIYGKKYKYKGTPRDLYINKDGGFSVSYEESAIVTLNYSNSSSSHLETYNILVSTYSKTGELKSSYLVPKDYWIDNASSMSYGGGFGNQYKRFAYINGNEKSYILINDTRRNIEKIEKNKEPIQIKGVGDCDAFYFPLTGSDPVPQRKYLFGESDDKKERSLSPFGIATYDRENDIFIVLKLNKEGRKESVNVAWLKPQ